MATSTSFNGNINSVNNKSMVTVFNSLNARLGKFTRVAILTAVIMVASATTASAQVRLPHGMDRRSDA